MKKFRKLLAFLLAITLLTAAILPVGAAERDAAASAASGAGVLKFDANSIGWSEMNAVQFYIYQVETGTELMPWGSEQLEGSDQNGDNIWEYQPARHGLTLESSRQYAVIFVNPDTMEQTYDLIFDTSCYGDTAYSTGKDVENPVDSHKTAKEVRWTSSSLGPRLEITSIGHPVGETLSCNDSKYGMLVEFLASKGKDGLSNALHHREDATAQQIIDEVAAGLGLHKDDVDAAVREAAAPNRFSVDSTDWNKDWIASRSPLPHGAAENAHITGNGKLDGSDSGGYHYGYSEFSDETYDRFCYFLNEELPDRREATALSDQQLVDEEAGGRSLCRGDVDYIIKKAAISGIEWNAEQSTLDNGYLYEAGAYYLIGTSSGTAYGIDNVRGYYRFTRDSETDFYTLDLYEVDLWEDFSAYQPEAAYTTVAVAQYLGDRFEIVSQEELAVYEPEFYFFRPDEDHYCFGYNDRSEMLTHNSGSSSGPGGSAESGYALPNPQMKSVVCTAEGLELSWDPVDGAEKYAAYVLEAGGWSQIAATSDTRFTYTGVESGNAYTFTLRCLSADETEFTSDYDRRGWTEHFLSAPVITTLKGYDDGVNIAWTPSAGNARYRVYMESAYSWIELGDTFDTSFTHSSEGEGSVYAHEGTKYTYTVRCVSYSGNALTSDYDREGKSIIYRVEERNSFTVGGKAESFTVGSGTPDAVSRVLRFDANSAGWNNANAVRFCIYDALTGQELVGRDSPSLNGSDTDGDGVWEYNPSANGIALITGKQYAIVFCNVDSGEQTYDLLFDTSCYGDVAFCTDVRIENPLDRYQSTHEARWTGSVYGPRMQFTSSGRLVGEMLPNNLSPYGMMVGFLASRGSQGLTNALDYNWQSAQQIIDNAASELGLKKDDVKKAIAEAAKPNSYSTDATDWSDKWNASLSSLPAGSSPQAYIKEGVNAGRDDVRLVLIGEKGEPFYATIISGDSCDYAIERVKPGAYTLRATKANHVAREYKVAVGDSDVVRNVKLHPIGDINGDGRITTIDFGKANSHARGKSTLEGYEFKCADVNADSKVTTVDSARINAAARGKTSLWK